MPKQIKIHAATFNVLDPWQKKLYEHVAKHTNVSAYLKSLIQRDMESQSAPAPIATTQDDVIAEGFI